MGELYITSNSVFNYPYINPNYLAHSADLTILREGFKMARQISAASPLSTYITGENTPGTGVSTDDEWNTWIEGAVGTGQS